MNHSPRAIPGHYEEVYPAPAVLEGVARVAAELTPLARESLETTGKQLLALCVLRGAVFFYSDLLKAIPISVEAAFCRCRGYEPGVNAQLAASLRVEGLDADLSGRSVLLVDDICDTGRTLAHLSELCRMRGAAVVRTAVLIHRLIPESVFSPDHTAFRYEGREWFTGYGMDDSSWRTNYPSVYALRGSGVIAEA
jgi:hypoxanthine phosphoribosyltransferase